MSEYRIVRDGFAGFEVQIKRWWWPFWSMIGSNTHPNIERAEKYAEDHARGFLQRKTMNGNDVVKELGKFITK